MPRHWERFGGRLFTHLRIYGVSESATSTKSTVLSTENIVGTMSIESTESTDSVAGAKGAVSAASTESTEC